MLIELDIDIADEAVVEAMREMIAMFKEHIEEGATGMFSMDDEEEHYAVNAHLDAFRLVLSYYADGYE